MGVSAFTVLLQVFLEPKTAFGEIKERSNTWMPLLLIILPTLAVFYWYFSVIDFSWFLERSLSAQAAMKPDARQALERFMTHDRLMITSLGGALLGMPIAFALFAIYYLIASKVLGIVIPYTKWFSFSVWVSVPGILSIPLMALQVASGHGQVALEDLNMLSLNFLIGHLSINNPWAGLLNSLSVTTFWTMFLTFIGFRVWTGRRVFTCTVVSVVPYAVIYGVWAAKIIVFS